MAGMTALASGLSAAFRMAAASLSSRPMLPTSWLRVTWTSATPAAAAGKRKVNLRWCYFTSMQDWTCWQRLQHSTRAAAPPFSGFCNRCLMTGDDAHSEDNN